MQLIHLVERRSPILLPGLAIDFWGLQIFEHSRMAPS